MAQSAKKNTRGGISHSRALSGQLSAQSGRISGTIRASLGNFICLIIRQLQKIINFFVHNACMVLF